VFGAADTAPQLIKIGQPKTIGPIDNDRVCVRNIESTLDDRGANEDIDFPRDKALHDIFQFIRILSIWLCGEAVGVDVSPLVYIVMGPLLFLVMLIPFTINGLGVREAFFIAFLGRFGVDADAAFATGFLFYAVTVAASIPGGAIMIWDSLRPALMRPREG